MPCPASACRLPAAGPYTPPNHPTARGSALRDINERDAAPGEECYQSPKRPADDFLIPERLVEAEHQHTSDESVTSQVADDASRTGHGSHCEIDPFSKRLGPGFVLIGEVGAEVPGEVVAEHLGTRIHLHRGHVVGPRDWMYLDQ